MSPSAYPLPHTLTSSPPFTPPPASLVLLGVDCVLPVGQPRDSVVVTHLGGAAGVAGLGGGTQHNKLNQSVSQSATRVSTPQTRTHQEQTHLTSGIRALGTAPPPEAVCLTSFQRCPW